MARVLVIGSGGREHAIAYKLFNDSHTVFVAPGNPGTEKIAKNVAIDINDFDNLIKFVKDNAVDLTIVGPEDPLSKGIVDAFKKEKLLIFGPSKKASMLEASKVFSKNLMQKYNIPTAKFNTFNDYEKAINYIDSIDFKIVIKADGLAAGKGVVIPETKKEAKSLLKQMMCENMFGEASKEVVIEEFLEGEEFSLLAFVKDELIIPMPIIQDHKKAFDNDKGLNTGGMGAYGPVKHISDEIIEQTIQTIMKPITKAMIKEDCSFTGILYGGFMLTNDGVKTIEFNVRFGDPETEILMLLLKTDLYEIIINLLNDKLIEVEWLDKEVVGVVLASKGYPQDYIKDQIIKINEINNSIIFHMGTKIKDNNLVNSGGRVLFVASIDKSLKKAVTNVYQDIEKIEAKDLFYRKDIAKKGIASFAKQVSEKTKSKLEENK